MAVRQHGRMCTEKGLWLACESAGDSMDVDAAPQQCCVLLFFGDGDAVVSLPIVETQKSQKNVSGVDLRETGLSFTGKRTTSLSGTLVSLTQPGVHIISGIDFTG